jgi:hypothetical protein
MAMMNVAVQTAATKGMILMLIVAECRNCDPKIEKQIDSDVDINGECD